jgi:hypothetical protein
MWKILRTIWDWAFDGYQAWGLYRSLASLLMGSTMLPGGMMISLATIAQLNGWQIAVIWVGTSIGLLLLGTVLIKAFAYDEKRAAAKRQAEAAQKQVEARNRATTSGDNSPAVAQSGAGSVAGGVHVYPSLPPSLVAAGTSGTARLAEKQVHINLDGNGAYFDVDEQGRQTLRMVVIVTCDGPTQVESVQLELLGKPIPCTHWKSELVNYTSGQMNCLFLVPHGTPVGKHRVRILCWAEDREWMSSYVQVDFPPG